MRSLLTKCFAAGALLCSASATLLPARVSERGFEWVVKPKIFIFSMLYVFVVCIAQETSG